MTSLAQRLAALPPSYQTVVDEAVSRAPDLTDDQRARLRVLMRSASYPRADRTE